MNHTRMKPFLFAIPLVMLVSSAFAAPGDFDDSFGTGGREPRTYA